MIALKQELKQFKVGLLLVTVDYQGSVYFKTNDDWKYLKMPHGPGTSLCGLSALLDWFKQHYEIT